MEVTKEEENFMKLTQLMLDVIPRRLRKLFITQWNSCHTEKWNSTSVSGEHLWSLIPIEMRNDSYLSSQDVHRKVQSGIEKSWDATLLIFLLLRDELNLIKNCTSVLQTPLRTSINNIRLIRNRVFAHAPSSELSSAELKTVSTALKREVSNAFGPAAVKDIDEILKSPLQNQLSVALRKELDEEIIRNDELQKSIEAERDWKDEVIIKFNGMIDGIKEAKIWMDEVKKKFEEVMKENDVDWKLVDDLSEWTDEMIERINEKKLRNEECDWKDEILTKINEMIERINEVMKENDEMRKRTYERRKRKYELSSWIDELSRRNDEISKRNDEISKRTDGITKFEREKDSHFIAEDGCVYRRFTDKTGRVRKQFIVPKKMVGQILVKFHDNPLSAHSGFYRTYRKIQMSYFWPTMKSDIKRHIRFCTECARFKSTKPATKTPMKSIEAERPLQIVAMDFVGPLPKSDQGNQYALVLVDHFTRWPVVYAVQDTEAETVARLLRDFIHCYGCPEELLSDRGSQFTSDLIKALCKQLGVKKIYTCAFRPSSNGLDEHLNGTLFNAVKMYASKKPSKWDEYLDAVTFAFRTTPHSVTMHTPAFLMYGREVNSPIDMKPPTRLYTEDYLKVMQSEQQQAYALVKELVAKEQQRQKSYHDRDIKELSVIIGDKVWLRDFIIKKGTSKKFHQPWIGPYEVSKVIGRNNVEIIMPEKKKRKTKIVNLEQIKLAQEIDGSPDQIVKVHDKLRSRLPGQRLVTRYFVEFSDGNTQWVDPEFVSDTLLEEFNATK